jgi:hypothetical protein
VEVFVAENWSLVECILYWRALSIAIASPLKLLTIYSIVFPSQNDKNCLKVKVRDSAVIVVPSNPNFVWLFSSHFIDFREVFVLKFSLPTVYGKACIHSKHCLLLIL